MTAGNARREASSSLSVIMACDGALHEIPDRLDALARACAGIPTDVFIVQAPDARVVIPADAPIPTHRVIATSALGACHSGSGRSLPRLRGVGMAEATGTIVGIIEQMKAMLRKGR